MVKLICIFLIVGFLGTCQEKLPPIEGNIVHYMELDVELSKDTVLSGSKFSLTVIFKNKTDTAVIFYPKTSLTLAREINGFVEVPDAYTLNMVLDTTKPYKVEPLGSYKEMFKVPVFVYPAHGNTWTTDSFRTISVPASSSSGKSKRDHSETIKIPVYPFLKKGKNSLFVFYYINNLEKGIKGYPVLYGELKSNKIEIFVQ